MKEKNVRIIPVKHILATSLIFLVFWPIAIYAAMSIAMFIVHQTAAPLYIFYGYGLGLGLLFELYLLLMPNTTGFYISKGTVKYLTILLKPEKQSSWTSPATNIKSIYFKVKGEEFEGFEKYTDRKAIIVFLKSDERKIMDMYQYSNRQIKKIIKLLNEVIE